ncbi:MAG: DUF808 domain-containing protein [Persicimonas sp.]
MAATSLLALIDDIATLLDDVSVMTKIAAQKTAGLVGDDLAVGAEQVTGFSSKREWPIIWAVAKGAALNKVIIIPAALLISAFIPWLILPLLMLGGAFLSYEGAHKVFEKFFHKAEDEENKKKLREAFRDPNVDMVAFEKKRIKGAIRTDFILSAEIIVIALGEVTKRDAGLAIQLGVLIAIGAIVTVVVYGLVAGIVKIDDVGLHLRERGGGWESLGDWLVDASPMVMKGLGIVGTIAMFLVGGGILAHGIAPVEHFIEDIAYMTGPAAGAVKQVLFGVVGLIAGAIIVGIISTGKKAIGLDSH